MRVACPSCSAEYDVPESLLAAGPRTLRCARCGHQFQAERPPQPAARPLPPIAPDPAPVPEPHPEPAFDIAPPVLPALDADRPPPTRGLSRHTPIDDDDGPVAMAFEAEPDRSRRVVAIGWGVSVLVLAVAAWALVHFQAGIVEAWPPAARLYSALGLG